MSLFFAVFLSAVSSTAAQIEIEHPVDSIPGEPPTLYKKPSPFNQISTWFSGLWTTNDPHKPNIYDQKPWPVSRYSIRLGGFWAINNTDLGISTDGAPFSVINFENRLGMNRHTGSVLVNFNARFGKHHRVDFSYYNLFRNKRVTTKQDIHFGEHDYPVDSDVKTHFNTNIFRLSYGYAFISNPTVEVGALLGFHIMAFGIGMDLRGETQQLSWNDDVNFTAPLPDLGLWSTYAFHHNWALTAEVGYFGIKISDFKGRLLGASLAGQYRLSEHWELDLGYTLFHVKVDYDRDRLQTDFKWSYNGPNLCIVYKFGH